MVASWNPFFFLKHWFHILHFPPDFPQNQPAAITLNTGSPQTLARLTYNTYNGLGHHGWSIDRILYGCLGPLHTWYLVPVTIALQELIGGKGKVDPRLFHTTLEGPTE
jgi:hypothetical protein